MRKTIRWEYAEPHDLSIGFLEESEGPPDYTFDEMTAEITVQKDVALTLQSEMRDAIDGHYDEYGSDPACVILGEREYAILDAFYQSEHGHSLKRGIEGVDVVTVPGRMIHVPKPHEHAIWDEVSEDE